VLWPYLKTINFHTKCSYNIIQYTYNYISRLSHFKSIYIITSLVCALKCNSYYFINIKSTILLYIGNYEFHFESCSKIYDFYCSPNQKWNAQSLISKLVSKTMCQTLVTFQCFYQFLYHIRKAAIWFVLPLTYQLTIRSIIHMKTYY